MSSPPFAPRPRRLPPSAVGLLFALLATFIWSFNFIAGRGLINAAPPCTLALGRWLVAAIAVLPFALPELKANWRHFFQHWRYYLLVSSIGIAYFNTAIYAAAHTVPALNLSLIATSAPLFTVLLSRILFSDPITPARALGIATAFCGILLLVTRGDIAVLAGLSFHTGDLLMLSGAFGFSLYTLMLRKRPAGCGQAAYFAVTFILGLLMLAPFSVWELTRGQALHFGPELAVGLLYMGLGATLLAFWCWDKAIHAIGPARASIIYYSLPLFSGIEAILLLGEPVLWVHYAGGGLILGGLALATGERKRPGA